MNASARAKLYRIEDIEDLVRLGGTFAEIVARSGYKNWETLSKALRASDRLDLLEAIRLKRIGDDAPTGLPPVKRKPICRKRACGRKRYAKRLCKKHYTFELNGYKQPNKKQCTVIGCERKHKGLGLCSLHYEREHRKNRNRKKASI